MKISYNWLKQFLDLEWEVEQTAELLTDLGLEVEGIMPFESVKGGLKGVVVGHVLSCEKHPNADRLKLTTVDVGEEKALQIVCGAPNIATGQKVPVATIGTTLYDENGKAWTIKKGKIRGEESHGMICAQDELGLGKDHEGIWVLDEKLIPGTLCAEVFKIENDHTIEIGLTPNRSDAMSHFGVARDLRAGLEQKGVSLKLITPSTSNFTIDTRTLKIDVEVADHKLAPRYCGVTLTNLKVKESPNWLQNRLKAIGLSPINNIVDATNYVLHELGQPLHAFDADRIKDKKIEVKTLPKGTKFETLDGMVRELHEDDLMICDSEKPMCIAGVFGGTFSGVTEETTSIFLESAYFDPVSIRKTAKRHGLNTDASFRFERGIDINTTKYALKRAASLIKELADGNIDSEIVDLYPNKREDTEVFLSFEKVNQLIGQEIPRETIKSILSSLEIKIKNVTEAGLGLHIPFYRTDVVREVDVIEEILRVYGYNNIHFKEKFTASVAKTNKVENHAIQTKVSHFLVANGFFEIITNSLTAPEKMEGISPISAESNVKMLNPLSADLSALRSTTLPTGLEVIRHNINRKTNDLKLFGFEKTYQKSGTSFKEQQHLSLFITGNVNSKGWASKERHSDFFYVKGVVCGLLEQLGIENLRESDTYNHIFSEGLTMELKNKPLVSFGVVTKAILQRFDLKNPVFYVDFDWDTILKLLESLAIVYEPIPKFPEVRRDLALLLDESISYKQLREIAFSAERKLLKSINLFDVYTGKNLPEGKKSYALSFLLQDDKKTLVDKEIERAMSKIEKALANQIGSELR